MIYRLSIITQNRSNTLDEELFAINARILVAAVGTRSSESIWYLKTMT
jgi:hypothetical protein